jgi:stearoyl-CoA desaturase (Delta-9 desaturase)
MNVSAERASRAGAEGGFAGVPEARLFLADARLQAASRRNATWVLGGSALATLLALAEWALIGAMPSALWVALGFYVIGMIGIGVGFHRLFAHRAFAAPTWLRVGLAIAGSMTAQGAVTYWVSNHRRHHAFTDQPNDVHSPHFRGHERLSGWKGFWHAQWSWVFSHAISNPLVFGKDLLRDRPMQRVSQLYTVWLVGGIVLPGVIVGAIEGSWRGVFDGMLWGGGVRLFAGIMVSSLVNSLGHLHGARSFGTADESRNIAWLALPTLGESWHNNHHALPASARFGLQWWQVDPGWGLILGLEALGLITDVRRPAPTSEASSPAAANDPAP